MGIAERRGREQEARRAAVLEAARSLLLERGFTGTTTKQIAERCELSEATLFFYFQSKSEILVSLLFEGIEFWARGLDRIATLELPPEQKLARIWRYFSEVRNEHPEYFHLSAYLAQPQATANVTDEVKAEIVRRSGENFQRLAQLMAATLDVQNGRPAADLLWSAFLGLSALRDSRANLGSKAYPTDREFGVHLNMLLNGLLSVSGKGGGA